MKQYDSIKIDLQKFLKKYRNLERNEIYEHFIKLGYKKRSLQRWVSILLKKKTLKRKVGSGRVAKIATSKTITKVKNLFNHRDGRSQRRAAATQIRSGQRHQGKIEGIFLRTIRMSADRGPCAKS